MVSQAGSRSGLPVSIKIRIHSDLRSVGVVRKSCDPGRAMFRKSHDLNVCILNIVPVVQEDSGVSSEG